MWLFLRTAVSRVSTSITVHFLVTPSRGIQYTWVTNFFPFQLFPLHMWFKWYTETFHGPVPHAVYFNPYCHLTNCHVLGFMQICGRSELVTQNPFFFFFWALLSSQNQHLFKHTRKTIDLKMPTCLKWALFEKGCGGHLQREVCCGFWDSTLYSTREALL